MPEWKLLVKEDEDWTEVASSDGKFSVKIDENNLEINRVVKLKDEPKLGF